LLSGAGRVFDDDGFGRVRMRVSAADLAAHNHSADEAANCGEAFASGDCAARSAHEQGSDGDSE